MRPYSQETIAEMVHETLRTWARVRGAPDMPAWAEAPDWMRASSLESVRYVLENPDADPGRQHIQWMKQKQRDGWVWGKTKDTQAKTHPMLVPFEDLPDDERAKDALLNAIVLALGKPV